MVSIDRSCPATPHASARAKSSVQCTSTKHHVVKMAMPATLECSVVRLQTLLAKVNCGSTWVPVENGAASNKKQVVCQICDCSLADTWETQQTCFITSNPTTQRNTVK